MGHASSTDRQALGRAAENLVAERLVAAGFVVLARNARVGRLELDIVARRGSLLVICEVRARRSARVALPAETVDARKQARLRRAARGWLAGRSIGAREVRFDVASVVFDGPGGAPRLAYYPHAF